MHPHARASMRDLVREEEGLIPDWASRRTTPQALPPPPLQRGEKLRLAAFTLGNILCEEQHGRGALSKGDVVSSDTVHVREDVAPWGILYETKVAQDVSEAKIGREVGEDLRGETLGAEETSVGVHVARAEGHGGGSADGFELRHESFGEETVEVVNAPERGNTLRDRDAVPRIRLAVRLRRQRTVSHDSGIRRERTSALAAADASEDAPPPLF